ncbi:MAG: hypothetical protein HYT12_00950 [Candidatus Liptonbacteria bacterium]|nr:hypothetical protein [Candidatus Liptonbacteria bacterium]
MSKQWIYSPVFLIGVVALMLFVFGLFPFSSPLPDDPTIEPGSAIWQALHTKEARDNEIKTIFEREEEYERNGLPRGVGCTWSPDATVELTFEKCQSLLERALYHKRLKLALSLAHKKGLNVAASDRFKVGSSIHDLLVNVNATDEEIADFLLGKQAKNETKSAP